MTGPSGGYLLAPDRTGPVDVDHYYCCDEDVAMCGADLRTVRDGFEFPDVCSLCVLVLQSGVPCGVAGCKP